MSPHFSYQRNAASAWTRIDLLLTVYDVGIQTAHGALNALAQGDDDGVTRQRLKFYRVLMQILDGLDTKYETTQNIQRLTLYMFDRASKGRPADWQAVLKVLNILREGFGAIRDQAVELESRGVVPAVDAASAVNVSV
ncbi:MAG: flagellar protein FliS [Planctomycetaceae bacterium]|nr:flagellar protein FliS [Planctomycetaceae bacterium]